MIGGGASLAEKTAASSPDRKGARIRLRQRSVAVVSTIPGSGNIGDSTLVVLGP